MKRVLKLILPTLLLISVIIAAGYFWLQSPPPASVNIAENALATKSLLAIGHINNSRLNHILYYSKDDPNSLNIPTLNNHIFFELLSGEKSELGNVEHTIFSLNNNDGLSSNIVLQGQFNLPQLKTALQDNFTIEETSKNTFTLTHIEKGEIDEFACPDDKAKNKAQKLYLTHNSKWVAISTDQKQLTSTVTRIQTRAPAQTLLTDWRIHRDSHLISAGFIKPSSSKPSRADRQAKAMAMLPNATESAYLGARVNVLEAGITLNAIINASDGWANSTAETANQKIKELQQSALKSSPTLASAFDSLNITTEHESLLADLTLKYSDLDKLNDVFAELTASLFFPASANPVELSKEAIEENLWDFNLNEKLANLPTFKPQDNHPTPPFIDGPLAISLNNISQNEKLDLLEVEVKGQINLPKTDAWWFHSNAEFALKIDSIRDNKGNELIRDERCAQDLKFTGKNHEPAKSMQVSNNVGSSNKTIRLNKGVKFADIDSIKGEANFSIPAGIVSTNIPLTHGVSFQKHGVRFFLNDFTQQSITYQLSGTTDKVIDVRALNNKNQVLKKSSAMTISGRKTAHYQGDIASIQLIVATRSIEYNSTFDLPMNKLFPDQKIKDYYLSERPGTVAINEWNKVSQASPSNEALLGYLTKDKFYAENMTANWHQAPIAFFMSHNIKSSWISPPNYHVAMPLINELAYNLQAFEINTKHEQESTVNYFSIAPYVQINGDSKGKYMPHQDVEKAGYLKGNEIINITVAAKQKLSTISGELNINLPKTIATINAGMPGFTPTELPHNTKVQLQSIDAGFIPRYTYKISSPNLINMIAVLDNGKELLPTQKNRKTDHWLLDFPLTNKIVRFDILVADEVEQIKHAFELHPEYKD